MRWIIARLGTCSARSAGEKGASAVMTALLLTVLLACVAVVVDVGLLYAERAQLQNGADTAALSVAYSCGQDLQSGDCLASSPSATQLSNSNALDRRSHVAELEIDKIAGTVHIKNVAQQPDRDPGSIALSFAQIFGVEEAAVSAEASAIWGNPVAGAPPFPIVFSECEIQGTTSLQLVRFRQQGVFNPGCVGGPPGGFGNLDQVDSTCEARVNIDKAASGSSTGNGIPANCSDLLKTWGTSIQVGQYPVGLFPVYKSVSESGSKATYSLSGFAAFEIHGWKLKQGGSAKYPELFRADYYPGLNCDKDCIGIIGKFIRHVSLDEDFTLGTGGKDMGAYVVRLTD
jgi:hypothetical protein